MDYLNELNLKFGPDTVWEKTGICGWCELPLIITDGEYRQKGNFCNKCKHKLNNTMPDHINRQLKDNLREIEELREQNDFLGKQLDRHDISDSDIKVYVTKMEQNFHEIQRIEKLNYQISSREQDDYL